MLKYILIPLLIVSVFRATAQDELSKEDETYVPLMAKLNNSGSKYIRFITWHQIWAATDNLTTDDRLAIRPRVRRSRLLAYAQISPRFMILTHWGLNNLASSRLTATGVEGNGPQVFLHGAWTEYKITDDLYIGAGLHYWNGLSRLSNASTLNFMTLDNYRQAWAQLGLSDQFARHLGIYAKGRLGKLNYHFAVNDAITSALGGVTASDQVTAPSYSGRALFPEDAATVVQGYVDYQFLDQESNKLPYRVGSYLGKKKVFNIGAGFFSHANGVVSPDGNGGIQSENVFHLAIDAYYDAPIGNGQAINAYAAFYNFNYGENYTLGTTYGTGSSVYGQVGYLLSKFSNKGRLMPYISYSVRDYEAFENPGNTFQVGANWFISGHNAKITIEYNSAIANYTGFQPDRAGAIILQTHIFL
ncbi:MAG: porin [Cyclobacteriaceae bacterium]